MIFGSRNDRALRQLVQVVGIQETWSGSKPRVVLDVERVVHQITALWARGIEVPPISCGC